jgi:hypothetical protein
MRTPLIESYWKREAASKEGRHADFISLDGKIVAEVKVDRKGLRRFHEGIFQLARCLASRPEVQRGYVLIVSPLVSRKRVQAEWAEAKKLFSPKIAKRLGVAAFDREGIWLEPNQTDYDQRLMALLKAHVSVTSVEQSSIEIKPVARQKHFEILKVLLDRWLLRQGPISIGKLAEQVGCVYPTASQALKWIDSRDYLLRHTNRSIELRCFPQSIWSELLAISGTLRQSIRFADASGGKPDLPYLIERLERLNPDEIAWGGVEAARHWHADFDLHGIPRIDISLHVGCDKANLGFLRKLDPALERIEKDSRSAILVVHPLLRSDPLYSTARESKLRFADPVETVLDLHEMGLTAQAGRLLAHLRPEIRLS